MMNVFESGFTVENSEVNHCHIALLALSINAVLCCIVIAVDIGSYFCL